MFRSKESTLQSTVSVMVYSLSGLDRLNEENVAQAMAVVEETGIPHLPQFFVADLLHPNDFGFTLMARGVVSKLQAILDARQ